MLNVLFGNDILLIIVSGHSWGRKDNSDGISQFFKLPFYYRTFPNRLITINNSLNQYYAYNNSISTAAMHELINLKNKFLYWST